MHEGHFSALQNFLHLQKFRRSLTVSVKKSEAGRQAGWQYDHRGCKGGHWQ